MIPQPLVERAAALMRDDQPIAEMFGAMAEHFKNPLLHADAPLQLDPRVFNARTFERVEGRARLVGDAELAEFMAEFARQRKVLDIEQEKVEEACKSGRVLPYGAAAALFRALGFTNDDEIKSLRINGYRFVQVIGQPALALVKDSPVALVE